MQSFLQLSKYDTEKYHEVSPETFFEQLGGVKPSAYCRWFWYRNEDPEQRHIYLPCGQTRRQRATVEDLGGLRSRVPGLINQYFTPNVFFDWRKKALLAGFCANYVEIDTTLNRPLRPDECAQVWDEVFGQLCEAGIPRPSAVVESGSGGLHLYWTYDLLDAYPARQQKWTKVARTLSASLTGGELWKVDCAATHDITRFLRVPGSIHSESVRDVTAYLSNEPQLSFDELATQLGIELSHQNSSFAPSSNEPVWQDSTRTSSSGFHSISRWWLRIFWHMNQFLRSRGKLRVGQRDSVAFIMFVALRRTVSLAKAWERIKEINREYIGLEESELEQYLSTASKVQYRYKKATLVDYFNEIGVPVPDFLTGPTVAWKQSKGLDREEIKRRQSRAGIESGQKRRHRSLGRLQQAIKDGFKSAKALASECKLSVRTIQRYLSALECDKR